MSLLETVSCALKTWPGIVSETDGIAVPTHCLYPSNGIVNVFVIGGERKFQVSDGGGALEEFKGSGGSTYNDLSVIRSIAKAHGLEVSKSGAIHSSLVTAEQLVGTIVLVANASKEAAHALEIRIQAVPRKNFRELLASLIDAERAHGLFVDVSTQRTITGASTKSHKFDYDISLAGHKRLLLDTVVPEASSINSVLAANLDVKAAELDKTIQRIVYDDQDNWKSADLALLGLGAIVVPFRNLGPILNRLAA